METVTCWEETRGSSGNISVGPMGSGDCVRRSARLGVSQWWWELQETGSSAMWCANQGGETTVDSDRGRRWWTVMEGNDSREWWRNDGSSSTGKQRQATAVESNAIVKMGVMAGTRAMAGTGVMAGTRVTAVTCWLLEVGWGREESAP